jgi:hypothetical protein
MMKSSKMRSGATTGVNSGTKRHPSRQPNVAPGTDKNGGSYGSPK